MRCQILFVAGLALFTFVYASPPFFEATLMLEDIFLYEEFIKLWGTKKIDEFCMDCEANPPIIQPHNLMVLGANASFQMDFWCYIMEKNMQCKMAHLNNCYKKEARDFEVKYAEYNASIKHLCVKTVYRDGLLKQLPCLMTTMLPQFYDCFKTLEIQIYEAKEALKSVKNYDKVQQEDEEYHQKQKACDSNEQFSSCVTDAARLFCGMNAELYVRHFLDKLMVEYRAKCQEPRILNYRYRGPKIVRAKKFKTKKSSSAAGSNAFY